MRGIKDEIPYNVGMFIEEYRNAVRGLDSPKELVVCRMNNNDANEFVFHHHYLHRKIYIARNVSYGLFMKNGQCVGVSMFGYPVWREYPGLVPPHKVDECPELIRLCTMDRLPANTESWFLSQCIKRISNDWEKETGFRPKFITSFCDEAFGFNGAIYRATNFELVRRTKGRPTNPGKAHGKWGDNDYQQEALKAFYVYRL